MQLQHSFPTGVPGKANSCADLLADMINHDLSYNCVMHAMTAFVQKFMCCMQRTSNLVMHGDVMLKYKMPVIDRSSVATMCNTAIIADANSSAMPHSGSSAATQ
jgi:hypothetical protein